MKKKLIITAVVIAALIVVGYGAMRVGVGFVFDKYVLETTLSSIAEQEQQNPNQAEPAVTQPELPEGENPDSAQTSTSDVAPQKKQLSKSEIISRVMKDSDLTYKMASMVSYEDKKRVISIVMSNFTGDELTQIAKNVSSGLSPEYKSKMIAEAQSRLTGAQWQECLNLAYKYIEEIRPYVE